MSALKEKIQLRRVSPMNLELMETLVTVRPTLNKYFEIATSPVQLPLAVLLANS